MIAVRLSLVIAVVCIAVLGPIAWSVLATAGEAIVVRT